MEKENKNIDENDIMKPTGKNDKLLVTTEGVFLNSDSLFIEYEDVLKSPVFTFLSLVYKSGIFQSIFDTDVDDINDYMLLDDLYKWYIERDNKNPFLSLSVNDNIIENEFNNKEDLESWLTDFYINVYTANPEICTRSATLNFHNVLIKLIGERKKTDLVKNIYIWHPFYCKSIEDDIKNLYGENIKFVYGDLCSVLKDNKVTNNSTFVFSDLYHINELKEVDLLKFSSLLIADRYFYNYNDDFEPIYPIEDYLKEGIFKINFFDNITTE